MTLFRTTASYSYLFGLKTTAIAGAHRRWPILPLTSLPACDIARATAESQGLHYHAKRPTDSSPFKSYIAGDYRRSPRFFSWIALGSFPRVHQLGTRCTAVPDPRQSGPQSTRHVHSEHQHHERKGGGLHGGGLQRQRDAYTHSLHQSKPGLCGTWARVLDPKPSMAPRGRLRRRVGRGSPFHPVRTAVPMQNDKRMSTNGL